MREEGDGRGGGDKGRSRFDAVLTALGDHGCMTNLIEWEERLYLCSRWQ